ncbi:MAG: glutamate--tRNA ligase [Rickettsiaceae bacterium]|nr:glutamate--tRNA ligase [Rickettsiaceae bacterium]
MKVRTRFAPSPTGMLHVGNARTALINKLFAIKNNGEFILRIDDTDLVRSKKEYEENIIKDLKWLGIEWTEIYWQSKRLAEYEKAKQKLIDSGRLYECFETPEELEIKRKFLLSSGRPPIYDRASLKLTESQKEAYKAVGRKPHYRFKLDGSIVEWKDMIRAIVHFEVANISDPILIKEDGTMTYMLCSCVDDIDFQISHVIRGEDHVSNTAIQIQIMRALDAKHPIFGHLSLIKTQEEKISKRAGGFEIASLREASHLEPMSINSFFANIGTKNPVIPYMSLNDLAKDFEISNFGLSPTNYFPQDLEKLNHKLLITLTYEEVRESLAKIGADKVTEEFWYVVRPNLLRLSDAKIWWDICYSYNISSPEPDSLDVLEVARDLLNDIELDQTTWREWTKKIKEKTGKSGQALYMPLRRSITGVEHGPELSDIILLIGKENILNRLNDTINLHKK